MEHLACLMGPESEQLDAVTSSSEFTGLVRFNLLTEQLISILPKQQVSLPELLALLSKDEVESFPALRPHQRPAWHMFLVQLAALSLHRAEATSLPESEGAWRDALRGLTQEFEEDEPWCLCVRDESRPAFLQPPVPERMGLSEKVITADELDILITARNHSLKRRVARSAAIEDWIFSLISLQTTSNYHGSGNYGVVRMSDGGSRVMLTLAPIDAGNNVDLCVRPGAWFRREVEISLATRDFELSKHRRATHFRELNGIGLTWVADWPAARPLSLKALDIWFIEVCRRVRLELDDNGRLRSTSNRSHNGS